MTGAFTIDVEQHHAGQRLDTAVAAHLSACSRSLAATLISQELILVNQQPKKPGYRLKAGDRIEGHIPAPEAVDYKPESIPLNIRYQDNHIIVIDKQPGMVVHPAPGHSSGTLVNALLFHCPDLGAIGGEIRPGIVHRLDKDTSGIMVIAKDSESQEELARQFKSREVEKKYLALVFGELKSDDGEIKLPIGRHPVDRKRMSTTTRKGRAATTAWTVRERLGGTTLLELNLKTGRTHQIRVHCSAIGHPVVGDPVYRSRNSISHLNSKLAGDPTSIIAAVKSAGRQQLHAWRLGLAHPNTGEYMTFEAPLPADMRDLIAKLRGGKRSKLKAER